ncbi:MAG TPA: hypothetical protein VEH83_03740 [Gemmatimonadales bacterium]|nr:hypothetical protein [Gemmatimonadales bacterium]
MNGMRRSVVAAWLLVVPAVVAAQGTGIESRLVTRGLPAPLAHRVALVAAAAAARGVPDGPLADKAIEGWAKQVPPDRIVVAVQRFADQMASARDAVLSAGIASPQGPVIAAAAEAMRSGMRADQVQSVVQAAGAGAIAAPGLSVAAALSAQGLGTEQATKIVVGAMQSHRSMAEILDLPSVARVWQDQGMSPGDIEHRMMDGGWGGGDQGSGRTGDRGDRPSTVPPGTHDHDGHSRDR